MVDHMNRTRRIGFDEADTADSSVLMKKDNSPIADSAKAHRILSGCVANLSSDDMMTVSEMLEAKGLLDKGELEQLKSAMSGKKDDPDMASDAAIMSRRRAQVAAGQRPASDLRLPINRGPTAADEKRFKEMFPDADRIKQGR